MKFGTSKRGDSYDIWGFQSRKFKCWYEIRYFHTAKFIWKFALPIRETLNSGIHTFIWSWVLPNREFHMKLGTFKQDIFIWNRVLSNREVPMFICNRALPSRYFIWNLSCPIGEIQMCIWNCVLPIREINLKSWHFQNENFIWNVVLSKREFHMKFGTLKSVFFDMLRWNLAVARSDGFHMFIWNSLCWNSKCEKSTILRGGFARSRGGFTRSRGGFSQSPVLSSSNPGISNVYKKWVPPSRQIHMTFPNREIQMNFGSFKWN